MQIDEKTASAEDLASAFEHIRALHSTICALMIDLAAMRQAVLKDQSVARRYRERLRIALKESRPLVGAALQAYDETICRIQTVGELRH